MSTITTEQWLTTEELATELKVAVETVRDWRKRGTGPRGTKIGHAVRYSRGDIAAWIAQTNGIPGGHA